MAFGLLTQLKESLLDLNVRKRVDLAELVDANLRELVLSRDVCEAINDPRRFMISTVPIRIAVSPGTLILAWQKWKVCLVD
jgi:hypothetical protein